MNYSPERLLAQPTKIQIFELAPHENICLDECASLTFS